MLRVSLLGEQVIVDERTGELRCGSSRTVALVAYLVAHAGAPQSRQRIAGLFWPDSSGPQALTNVRRELHQLRQILGDEMSLVVTSRDLTWRDTPGCRVDVREFALHRAAALASDVDATIVANAAKALDRYRGEFLPGRQDEWVLAVREELERQCGELCDLLSSTRARTGDLAGAIEVARRRVQLRPLEEVGYRALMEWQAELGDRAGAVSTFHRCASVLERELGVDPDPSTRRAVQRLLARDHGDVEPAVTRAGLSGSELIGRAHELGVLESLWREAAAGPRLVLVCGDAGVGKTRLVAELAELARARGGVVASTRCFGAAGRLALAPVADWLRHPAVEAATTRLEPVWRTEVERLVPPFAAGGAADGGAQPLIDAWQRHRFFEGLARALIEVGRRTLLVLDNVQWCDQETLAFLTFVLGLDPEAPLMVVGTLRADDSGPAAVEWAARMGATGLLTEMTLEPLHAAATAQLAETISGRSMSEEEATLLYAATAGYPLSVVEAVRAMIDRHGTSAPDRALGAVLRRRLAQATSTAREVAGVAAVVGTQVTLDLLTEAADLEAVDVVHGVDELWRRRILRVRHDGYEFSHDLLRDTAYEMVSPARRWLLHRRVAQGLELLHAADTDAVSVQLAEQYARAGRPERAVVYYGRAAEIAVKRSAHVEAVRLQTAALDAVSSMPEGRARDGYELAVLEAIGAPLNAEHGYASPELQRVVERSLALAESLGRRDSAQRALVALWTSRQVQGRIADGHRVANRALAMVDPDAERSGPAHFAVAGAAFSCGIPAAAARHFELAATLSGDRHVLSVGARPDVYGRAWAAHAYWLLGQDDAALASCRAAVARAREIDHPYTLAASLAYAGITHQLRGDVPAMTAAVAEARDLCDRYGFAYYREWVLILDGWSRGDASGAAITERGIDNLRAEGSLSRMPYWLSLLADLLTGLDRHDAARETLDEAIADGLARDDVWWMPEVMRMRSAHDQREAAVDRLRSAARMASAHGSVALLQRCTDDLARRGVRPVTD
ncbi:ATP-binding protein [Actinomycetospora straminea]|uniref:AAA family ATPase n=1 Tax=Actinomycetospora straminea TaxID=663607 RepID=A0ABP9EDF5_9PSEU|nr:AAA family ATPase [Actinomycetospora straminea]MDD7934356.1 AAA family ATPase [Actinomycetospora straminea]